MLKNPQYLNMFLKYRGNLIFLFMLSFLVILLLSAHILQDEEEYIEGKHPLQTPPNV